MCGGRRGARKWFTFLRERVRSREERERERRSLGRQGCIKGCACAVAAVTDCTWRDGRLPLDQRNGTLALTSGSCATVTLAFETEILIRFIRSERGREAAMTAEAKKKDL